MIHWLQMKKIINWERNKEIISIVLDINYHMKNNNLIKINKVKSLIKIHKVKIFQMKNNWKKMNNPDHLDCSI